LSSSSGASIIIPTGGRIDSLVKCLESIQRYAPESEIIVVGQTTDPSTRRFVLDNFPSVRYLETEESSAVVKRNLGIVHSTNEILVFVDDDVIVESAWLKNLLRHYEDNSVGGVGGKVKTLGLETRSSKYPTGVIDDGFVIGNWNPSALHAFEVQHLLGCNMSFRKTPVLRLGGFDNFFRSYNFREETDLCLRIRLLGYRLIFDPEASLIHEALGRKNARTWWIYYYVRNTVYLYLKYHVKSGLSMVRFLRRLIFPPKDYAGLSGVEVSITPMAPLVVTCGIISGLLGYLGHHESVTQPVPG
jgi:GT2 family glycosyltransferase